MNIIALTTCHNRRDITLRAVDSLLSQSLPKEYSLDICLVDDGSTDGTSDAVKSNFPGDLFWAGGMRFGWEKYVKNQDFDYLLVFNDDIELFTDAIEKLLVAATEVYDSGTESFAITGAFIEPDSKETAYGGVVRSSKWHPLRFRKIRPQNFIQDCDTLNMNLALISRQALERIGFLSQDFIHAGADYDFGLRLRDNGGRVVLAAGYMGECSTNSLKGTSLEEGITFKERWHRLTSIKEQSPRQRALYYRKHAGFFWPLLWALPYLRICISGK